MNFDTIDETVKMYKTFIAHTKRETNTFVDNWKLCVPLIENINDMERLALNFIQELQQEIDCSNDKYHTLLKKKRNAANALKDKEEVLNNLNDKLASKRATLRKWINHPKPSEHDRKTLDKTRLKYEIYKDLTMSTFDCTAPENMVSGYIKNVNNCIVVPFDLDTNRMTNEQVFEQLWGRIAHIADSDWSDLVEMAKTSKPSLPSPRRTKGSETDKELNDVTNNLEKIIINNKKLKQATPLKEPNNLRENSVHQ